MTEQKKSAAKGLTIDTTRFGMIDVVPESRVHFPRGLLGFEDMQDFVFLTDQECEPFRWLQSMEDPGLAFIVVKPTVFFPHYRVEVDRRELMEIVDSDSDDFDLYAIITAPEDISRMSANLQGPIIVNTTNQRAKQVVLLRSPYTTRHYLMDEIQRHTRAEERHEMRQKVGVT